MEFFPSGPVRRLLVPSFSLQQPTNDFATSLPRSDQRHHPKVRSVVLLENPPFLLFLFRSQAFLALFFHPLKDRMFFVEFTFHLH